MRPTLVTMATTFALGTKSNRLPACLSVRLSVCHKHCFFFFVSRWNRVISWPSVLHDKNYTKHCPSIFDLGPLAPKIYSPKFAKKSPISRLVWQIDRGCLHLPGGFRGRRFNGTIQYVVGRLLFPWQRNLD